MAVANLNRRHLIGLLAATALSPWCTRLHAATPGCHAALTDGLDLNVIREIGLEYQRIQPDDQAARVAALLEIDSGDALPFAQLRQLMDTDYIEGRVVQLSGWFMSRTEAQLFAAFSACN